MSRITQDQNQWGSGDLNGTPSSTKTNGGHTKRYGPLGVAGVGGNVKGYGSNHEAVFELSGDELVTEDGTLVTAAFGIELPADAIITGVSGFVHSAFGGGTPDIDFDGVTIYGVEAKVDLTTVGATGVVALAALIATTANGGKLTIDLTGLSALAASQSGGQADIVVHYSSL